MKQKWIKKERMKHRSEWRTKERKIGMNEEWNEKRKKEKWKQRQGKNRLKK